MISTAPPCFTLRDGNSMPQLGFGTYRVKPGDIAQGAVAQALSVSASPSHGPVYRHIDTAALYRNEADCGKALNSFLHDVTDTNEGPALNPGSKLKREDFFVTTKLWNSDHGFEKCRRAFSDSLKRLNVGYIDLYLMHSPIGGKLLETYDCMIALKKEGKVKSIGVSNFGVKHLELLKQAGREPPAVNQIELHPFKRKARTDVVNYCKANNILIVAYGSLFAGYPQYLSHPAVQEAAQSAIVEKGSSRKTPVTAGQVLLRWALDQGFAVIPKSVTESRIWENAMVFDFQISEAGRAGLDALEGHLGDYWDPLDVEIGAEDRLESSGRRNQSLRQGR